jgi:membrane protease YdiL (CAAX protease family)
LKPCPSRLPSAAQRLRWLEAPGRDFPFYNGAPISLSAGQWLLVLLAVVAGFLVLVLPVPWPGAALGSLMPALLFPAIALAALVALAPGHWMALFGRVGWRECRLMFGFALLNIVVSFSVGAIVRAFADVTPNAATAQLAAADTTRQVLFFVKTIPQLFGEEVVTILPFLAVLSLLYNALGWQRRVAVVGAWLVSSLLFGLIHLPTYDWNLIQCVLIIGSARMVLSLAYILTKNIWVSTGAHVINDWLLFGMTLLGAGLMAAP